MNILAIDLGKFNSMFCFFDSASQSAEFFPAPTSRSYFLSILKNLPIELADLPANLRRTNDASQEGRRGSGSQAAGCRLGHLPRWPVRR